MVSGIGTEEPSREKAQELTGHAPAPLEFTADSLEGNFQRVTERALTEAPRTRRLPFLGTWKCHSLASAGLSKLLCEAARPCLGSPMM